MPSIRTSAKDELTFHTMSNCAMRHMVARATEANNRVFDFFVDVSLIHKLLNFIDSANAS